MMGQPHMPSFKNKNPSSLMLRLVMHFLLILFCGTLIFNIVFYYNLKRNFLV
jgi:hypothetical protein